MRAQLAARDWAHHVQTRDRIAAAVESAHKAARMRRLRDDWRAQMATRHGGARQSNNTDHALQ